MTANLIICLLDTNHHDRDAFDCGEPSLNEYLQKTAGQHLKMEIWPDQQEPTKDPD